MATLATFWKFAKRLNSTALPSADLEKEEWYIIVKEQTSIINITLECHNANVKTMNYLYLPLYERYYFIRDVITLANETYDLICECDVIGTFGEQVLGQSIYMSYASYGYNDQLNDERVQPTNGYEYKLNSASLEPLLDSASMNFLYETMSVTCVDGDLSGVEVIQGENIATTYINQVMEITGAKDFFNEMSGANPLSPINGLWLTPFKFQNVCANVELVGREVWGRRIIGYGMKSPKLKTWGFELEVPKSKYNDFRNCDRYLQYTIYMPLVGVVNIPTNVITDYSKIIFYVTADPISGDITYQMRFTGKPKEYIYGMFTGNAKVQIPIGSVQNQTAKTIGALAGSVATFAGAVGMGSMMGGAVGATVGGLAGMLVGGASVFSSNAMPPRTYNVGSFSGGVSALGSLLGDGCKLQILLAEAGSTSEPSSYTEYSGRPCQRVQAISKGFCQSPIPSVKFAGKVQEIEAFNNALRGGVYFE